MFDWIKRKGIHYRKLINILDSFDENKELNERYHKAYFKWCAGEELTFDESVDFYIHGMFWATKNIELQRQGKEFYRRESKYRNIIKYQVNFIKGELDKLLEAIK